MEKYTRMKHKVNEMAMVTQKVLQRYIFCVIWTEYIVS
jgi:hypothetical protein